MSPESVDYMETAERALDRARRSAKAEIHETAAREAYFAALNAARAVIFDRTGVAPKTHSGARAQFFALIRQGLVFDRDLASFLAKGFDMKQNVDYGPFAPIAEMEAEAAVLRAEAFVAAAKSVCAAGDASE